MVRIYFELSVMVLFGQGLMFGFFDYGDVIGVDLVVLGIYFGKVNLKVRIIFKGVRNQEGGGGFEKMLIFKLYFYWSMFYCLLNEIKIIISFFNQDFFVKYVLLFFFVMFFSCFQFQ